MSVVAMKGIATQLGAAEVPESHLGCLVGHDFRTVSYAVCSCGVLYVDAVKDAVHARQTLTEPGPGAIHFPRRLDADCFRQLTAERVVTRFDRGRPIRLWQP